MAFPCQEFFYFFLTPTILELLKICVSIVGGLWPPTRRVRPLDAPLAGSADSPKMAQKTGSFPAGRPSGPPLRKGRHVPRSAGCGHLDALLAGSANSPKMTEGRRLLPPGGPVVRPYTKTGCLAFTSPSQTMHFLLRHAIFKCYIVLQIKCNTEIGQARCKRVGSKRIWNQPFAERKIRKK